MRAVRMNDLLDQNKRIIVTWCDKTSIISVAVAQHVWGGRLMKSAAGLIPTECAALGDAGSQAASLGACWTPALLHVWLNKGPSEGPLVFCSHVYWTKLNSKVRGCDAFLYFSFFLGLLQWRTHTHAHTHKRMGVWVLGEDFLRHIKGI